MASNWAEREAQKIVTAWWAIWDRAGCVNQIAMALDRARVYGQGGEARAVHEISARAIEDYDRREAAGEDVSGEIRPRMPGGSDF